MKSREKRNSSWPPPLREGATSQWAEEIGSIVYKFQNCKLLTVVLHWGRYDHRIQKQTLYNFSWDETFIAVSSVAIYSLYLWPETKYLDTHFSLQNQREEKLRSYVRHCGLLFSIYFVWGGDFRGASRNYEVAYFSMGFFYFPKGKKATL
jgi:hypothetical protein